MRTDMTPRTGFALALIALAGCPPPQPVPPPPRQATEQETLTPLVAELSHQAEGLLHQQDELIWKHWTEGAPIDIAHSYLGHEELFSAAAIRRIDRLRQLTPADSPPQRALTHLLAHFVGEYLARALSDQTEAIANLEASLTFSLEGKDRPYRTLDHLLATEKSAPARQAMYVAATPAVERLSALVRVKQDRAEELLKQLGYPSYEAYGAQLREANLVELAPLADQILQVTQGAYEKVMDDAAQRELQTPLAKLHRSDLPRLFRSGGVDALFGKDVQVARAKETVKGLGIDLEALRNFVLDAKESPKKNPRSLCLALEIPGDVRLTVRPGSGVHATAMFMHELGHALHYVATQEPRFELAKLGDEAVYESFALLFEDLLGDPVWLQQFAAMPQDKLTDYLASTSAFRLYRLRFAAGRVLYEVQLHRTDAAEAKALYQGIFSRVLGFPLTAEEQARYLIDQEDFYSSVDDFRAGFLAGQIQGQLKARFGPSWWRSAEAGAFLKRLWARGNAITTGELAQALGDDGLKPDVLLLRLASLLNVQMTIPATLHSTAASLSKTAPVVPLLPPDSGTPTDGGTVLAPADAGRPRTPDAG